MSSDRQVYDNAGVARTVGLTPGDVQQERRGVCLPLILPLVAPRLLALGAGERRVGGSGPGSERVLRHVYPQSDHRTASEVDDGVDSDHLQVQLYLPGPFDGACHHQGGTDGACLLRTEPRAFVREGLACLRGQGQLVPRNSREGEESRAVPQDTWLPT